MTKFAFVALSCIYVLIGINHKMEQLANKLSCVF